MTDPVTQLRYDVIHQSYNDIAHIRDDGITPDYTLDWETRDAFERRAIEVHDEDLYEALTELEDEVTAFRANAGNEYSEDDFSTTPKAFFMHLEGKSDPESGYDLKIYEEKLKKTTGSYSEDITTFSEAVTAFEIPFSVAENSDQLRTLMRETDEAPEPYIALLEGLPQGYDDLYQAVTEEGMRETILETSSWQLNYASIEEQASTIETMLDDRIRQIGEPDEG